jgi:hypothetical protein
VERHIAGLGGIEPADRVVAAGQPVDLALGPALGVQTADRDAEHAAGVAEHAGQLALRVLGEPAADEQEDRVSRQAG